MFFIHGMLHPEIRYGPQLLLHGCLYVDNPCCHIILLPVVFLFVDERFFFCNAVYSGGGCEKYTHLPVCSSHNPAVFLWWWWLRIFCIGGRIINKHGAIFICNPPIAENNIDTSPIRSLPSGNKITARLVGNLCDIIQRCHKHVQHITQTRSRIAHTMCACSQPFAVLLVQGPAVLVFIYGVVLLGAITISFSITAASILLHTPKPMPPPAPVSINHPAALYKKAYLPFT